MAIYDPIVMYVLRLFVVVLQELHCLPNSFHVGMIRVGGFNHFTKFHWLNVLPVAVYCCYLPQC